MKRRDFLKRLLGVAAISIVAKAGTGGSGAEKKNGSLVGADLFPNLNLVNNELESIPEIPKKLSGGMEVGDLVTIGDSKIIYKVV